MIVSFWRNLWQLSEEENDDEDDDNEDDDLFLWYGWTTKAFSFISIRDHCQRSSPSQISDMLLNRVWTCVEHEFMLSWMKLCSSDNHYTTALQFILYRFLEILQRYSKLVVFNNLGMPGYAHQKGYYQFAICRKILCLPAGKKSISCFSGDTPKICKLILGTFGMPAFTQQKWHHQLVENFNIYLHAKNKVRHVLLPWDIETLEFYWLTAFGPITGDPEFCQIPDWCWNINGNISFYFRLFSRKNNYKIFQNFQKNPILGTFWLFCQKFGQKWVLLEKRALSVFKYYNYLPSCHKSEKTIVLFVRKMLDWQMNGQAEGQTENCDFVGPPVREGSNY